MTTNEAGESKERLPEHAQRLDPANVTLQFNKAMIRPDSVARTALGPWIQRYATGPAGESAVGLRV